MDPETNVQTTEWSDSDYLIENDFDDLAAERIELKRRRDALDERIDELNAELGAMMATANLKSVRFEDWRLQLGYATSGGHLREDLLLEAGVTAAQLDRGRTPKKVGKPYIRITEIG